MIALDGPRFFAGFLLIVPDYDLAEMSSAESTEAVARAKASGMVYDRILCGFGFVTTPVENWTFR